MSRRPIDSTLAKHDPKVPLKGGKDEGRVARRVPHAVFVAGDHTFAGALLETHLDDLPAMKRPMRWECVYCEELEMLLLGTQKLFLDAEARENLGITPIIVSRFSTKHHELQMSVADSSRKSFLTFLM